jgi:hypothetical protein
LPNLAKTVQSKIIESLSYGAPYTFTVRTVDTAGNKSSGRVTDASLDTVIDDFSLDRYITSPVGGATPNTQPINAVQYNGAINWRNPGNNPFSGSVFMENLAYGVWVTLTANPGYTFQGVGVNSFTHTDAVEVLNPKDSGAVIIVFPNAIRGWYVSDLIGNDGNDGSTPINSLKTVAEAVEQIRTAYESPAWPGKSTNNPVSAVIIISGYVPLSTQILISNTFKNVPSAPPYTATTKPLPPIVLRGAGPDNIGIITGPANGRILEIANGAKVTMENDLVLRGNAVGLTTGDGGGVNIGTNSTFTMTGGTITASTPNGCGGAVWAEAATFLMKGGTITGSQAQRGAGVAIRDGTFTMSGGSIEDNGTSDATVIGGGVSIVGNVPQTSFTMSGGTITGNKANEAGGVALERDYTLFTMDGGTIAGNQAVLRGGGMVEASNAKAVINDGVISGNTAGHSGGGIYIAQQVSDVTIHGGTILGNTAEQLGGGVCVSTINGGTPGFTMQGGTLAENQAGTYGGGVYIMDGGVFTKQPLTLGGSSGVIYGYSADNPGSNKVLGLGIEVDHGHAVYIENGPKKRETTVSPDQHLDSADTGGWAEE